MDIEKIKGMFLDVLKEYPELEAQYDYDEKRNWFGIIIYQNNHQIYNYSTDTDQINIDKIKIDIAQWKKSFAG